MKSKLLAALLLLSITLTGCGVQPKDSAAQFSAVTPAYETGVQTRIASMKGPTAIGLMKLMADADGGEHYAFTMATGADEIVPLIAKGEVDIALVPANLAATLYQKTSGGVAVIDLNTLSVLEVVTANTAVKSIADLAGKTIYMTGKGTVPEYTLQYLLKKNGLHSDAVTVEFKTEPAEVVAALTKNTADVGILPQPFVTVATMKNQSLQSVLQLGDAWNSATQDGSQIVTGTTIVRRTFLEEHPAAVAQFLNDHAASVDYVNGNVKESAALVEQFGIVKAAVAEKAIPSCNLVCITGRDMKTALSGYLQALFDLSPDTVGGKLPDEAFYYLG